jgi:hypothetical protein
MLGYTSPSCRFTHQSPVRHICKVSFALRLLFTLTGHSDVRFLEGPSKGAFQVFAASGREFIESRRYGWATGGGPTNLLVMADEPRLLLSFNAEPRASGICPVRLNLRLHLGGGKALQVHRDRPPGRVSYRQRNIP